jgi:hypothetical protein
MSVSTVTAILFAKDLAKVAGFYRGALGVTPTTSDANHTILSCGGFDLIIHQIPHPMADSIVITIPPKRCETGTIRLNFTINSVTAARQVAASLGGEVDETAPVWAAPGAKGRLGHDPEGNVFFVDESAL